MRQANGRITRQEIGDTGLVDIIARAGAPTCAFYENVPATDSLAAAIFDAANPRIAQGLVGIRCRRGGGWTRADSRPR